MQEDEQRPSLPAAVRRDEDFAQAAPSGPLCSVKRTMCAP